MVSTDAVRTIESIVACVSTAGRVVGIGCNTEHALDNNANTVSTSSFFMTALLVG
jgi:hypothetical protein